VVIKVAKTNQEKMYFLHAAAVVFRYVTEVYSIVSARLRISKL
jgi:hypothetical protein